jgi:hypothetical protein
MESLSSLDFCMHTFFSSLCTTSYILGSHLILAKYSSPGKPSAQMYNWATLFLGDINMGTWPSRLGESQELRQYMVLGLAELRWRGPAATVNYRPVLSSERALHNNKPTTV